MTPGDVGCLVHRKTRDGNAWAGPQGAVQPAYQEEIPARNAIYAHAQDFSAGDDLLLAILKAFIPQPVNK
jgi:hypothetical protein